MRVVFHLAIGLILIMIQTALLPAFSLFDTMYDLAVPYILYLGIYCHPAEGVLGLLFVGLCTDSISGAPFGLYLTTYLWLFGLVRQSVRYLHVGNQYYLPLVAGAGVLGENLWFFLMFWILDRESAFSSQSLAQTGGQLIWAVLTGAPLMLTIRSAHKRWSNRIHGLSTKKARG